MSNTISELMPFVSAFKDKVGETDRFVFEFADAPGVFAVVKRFHGRGRPATLKLWDLREGGSLEKTISYWHTNVPFVPDTDDVKAARAYAQRLLRAVLVRVEEA